jgi:PAS domain-containing protein
MTDREKTAIKNTWMGLEVKFGFNLKTILIWAIPIGSCIVLIILFGFIWNRRLSKEVVERKRAEETVRETVRKSEQQLSMILQTTAQGFWLNDNDDKMMDVNEAMCEILDLPKEEIVGMNFFDFLDEKNREIVREQNRIRKF